MPWASGGPEVSPRPEGTGGQAGLLTWAHRDGREKEVPRQSVQELYQGLAWLITGSHRPYATARHQGLVWGRGRVSGSQGLWPARAGFPQGHEVGQKQGRPQGAKRSLGLASRKCLSPQSALECFSGEQTGREKTPEGRPLAPPVSCRLLLFPRFPTEGRASGRGASGPCPSAWGLWPNRAKQAGPLVRDTLGS